MTPLPANIMQVTPDREIVTTRVVKAPQALVYRAWTVPAHLANWWGPSGFTNTFHQYDLQPGGKWRFTMHGPDKGNYPNECILIEAIPPGRVAWNHVSPPEFQILATFEALNEQETRVIFRQLFTTAAACDKIRNVTAGKNDENLDRLEAELEKMKC